MAYARGPLKDGILGFLRLGRDDFETDWMASGSKWTLGLHCSD